MGDDSNRHVGISYLRIYRKQIRLHQEMPASFRTRAYVSFGRQGFNIEPYTNVSYNIRKADTLRKKFD